MKKFYTLTEDIQIERGNIEGLKRFHNHDEVGEELQRRYERLSFLEELESKTDEKTVNRIKCMTTIVFLELDEVETKWGRARGIIDGEVTVLSCKDCGDTLLVKDFSNNNMGFVGKSNFCKKCKYQRDSKYDKQNPEDKFARAHNHRARKHGNKGDLTADSVKMIFERSKNTKDEVCCSVTGKPLERACLGHIVAVNKQGGHSTLNNMVVLSKQVNNNQGDMNLYEFLLSERGMVLADKETIQGTVEMLADAKGMTLRAYLERYLETEQVERFIKCYF